jgi:hypothetical protein
MLHLQRRLGFVVPSIDGELKCNLRLAGEATRQRQRRWRWTLGEFQAVAVDSKQIVFLPQCCVVNANLLRGQMAMGGEGGAGALKTCPFPRERGRNCNA